MLMVTFLLKWDYIDPHCRKCTRCCPEKQTNDKNGEGVKATATFKGVPHN
jgi:hypothetical protein